VNGLPACANNPLPLISAYSAFVTFFEEEIKKSGVVKTLEDFVFSDAANDNNINMLIRLMSGA